MLEITDEEFERMVSAGLDDLPPKFAKHMQNVAVTWDYEPNIWQRMKIRLRPHGLLLGLYEGIPKTSRGNNYSLVLPDKITLFKRPLAQVAQSPAHLEELVKNTVWHEVAHHFGLSDAEIHRREGKHG